MSLRLAAQVHKKGELDRALRLYKAYHKDHPKNIQARHMIGTVFCQKGEFGQAVDWLQPTVEQGCRESYPNLIAALRKLGRGPEAVACGQQYAQSFKPGSTDMDRNNDAYVMINAASGHIEIGDYAGAVPLLENAISVIPDHRDANWNLSLAHLYHMRWEEGWKRYGWGFKAQVRGPRPYTDEFPEWDGESLKGKTLLVWGEQGLGDEILFAGCIPDVEKLAKRVIFDCHPRLEDIFARSFSAECIGVRKTNAPGLFDGESVDYQIPVGGLARFFRKSDSEFPQSGYLKPDPKGVEKWKAKIGPGLKVGLSWRGGSEATNGFRRSMSLEDLAGPLVLAHEINRERRAKPVQFVSLQYGGAYEEVASFNARHGTSIQHHDGALENYTETADLVAACDVVISVITAVIHLGGAMDVPVLCLVPHGPPWKFPKVDRMPWHPSVRLFHQEEFYKWQPVLEAVKKEFVNLVEAS